MPQEVSISYQAVKSKVYKLVDAMVEGDKNPVEVQESIRRWWKLIHPSDRAVAQKYLLMVLEKSNSTLGAIVLGLPDSQEVKARPEPGCRTHSRADRPNCNQQPGLKHSDAEPNPSSDQGPTEGVGRTGLLGFIW